MSEFEMKPRRRRKREPKWKRFLRRYGPSLMLLVLAMMTSMLACGGSGTAIPTGAGNQQGGQQGGQRAGGENGGFGGGM